MRRAAVVLVCLFVAVSADAQPAAHASMSLHLTDTAAAVTGATPNGDVLFFGVANEAGGYYSGLVRYGRVVTADTAGSARWQPPIGMQPRAVWFAIDLTTAAFQAVKPPTKATRARLTPPSPR